MRVVNTSTLELKDTAVSEYAILSHVWGQSEVTFQEMLGDPIKRPPSLTMKSGYRKIKNACAQALRDGFEHIWIDTCCIDKISSAELSEAINSMYLWYRDSTVCYAYLGDAFETSKWFERGWTLQELIAPQMLCFMITNGILSEKVFVTIQNLSDNGDYIAEKMSWASERVTTRIEDTVYCLMGIFGIHMPILYGQKENAFYRLQREIINSSDDQTIFAWGVNQSGYSIFSGLLASSPRNFRGCAKVRRTNTLNQFFKPDLSPYTITNIGMRIQLPLMSLPSKVTVAILDATLDGNIIGISLAKGSKPNDPEWWMREDRYKLPQGNDVLSRAKNRTIYVKETHESRQEPLARWKQLSHMIGIKIRPSCREHGYSVYDIYPPHRFRIQDWKGNKPKESIYLEYNNGDCPFGMIAFNHPTRKGSGFVVRFGLDVDNHCSADIVLEKEIGQVEGSFAHRFCLDINMDMPPGT
ncbi:Similar to Vegetative incompatibility protein HET-E-1; acc. no. Q00808 [Pyronema omphalodes CBS 100304]|uniref:Similar to Vegetative incompatibility protein HET-E-1 acc. no. Q00808 n=1 Tax=Pyronema omphalodes (strain CBS 100304) TaxID=1076935 RepID=U4KZR2_PYROM|nr:Similar to Vegetative incompatibility protein HET-E-1; acc. no. Q00808 [Pyronema omphalodes CBS 100304]